MLLEPHTHKPGRRMLPGQLALPVWTRPLGASRHGGAFELCVLVFTDTGDDRVTIPTLADDGVDMVVAPVTGVHSLAVGLVQGRCNDRTFAGDGDLTK